MKVVLLNHSDTLGGASVVTYRLMRALRRAGVDARMLVSHKSGADPAVAEVGSRAAKAFTFLAEHAGIFLRNGFSRADLFKASTGRFGLDAASHPWVREADVVCLGWVNQGMLSLDGIRRIARAGKRLIWTMHDMWNLTGICHHAGECGGYRGECGRCPLVHLPRHGCDLSRSVWRRKQALYAVVPVTFVAVSNWLAARCRESSLMRGADVHVIPNAFPVDEFTQPPQHSRADLGLPAGDLIVMGAARLDDPVKGFGYAIDALNILASRGVEARAVFFGDIRDRSLLGRLALPHVHLGPLDAARVRSVYAHARVVLSTSLYETLPGTLIEGQAAGCVPVTFGEGGQADIVEHGVTGFIADYLSATSVADNICKALAGNLAPGVLRQSVRAKFSSEVVARRYIDLFNA